MTTGEIMDNDLNDLTFWIADRIEDLGDFESCTECERGMVFAYENVVAEINRRIRSGGWG
jgi:hypothetical protein